MNSHALPLYPADPLPAMSRRAARVPLLAVLISACALAWDPALAQAQGGTASVKLSDSIAWMTLTSDTEWTLSKIGTVNEANSTVTWMITATEGTAVAGHLVIDGEMTVTNICYWALDAEEGGYHECYK